MFYLGILLQSTYMGVSLCAGQRVGLFALRRLARLIPRLRSGLRCYYPLRCKHTHKVHQQQMPFVLQKNAPMQNCVGALDKIFLPTYSKEAVCKPFFVPYPSKAEFLLELFFLIPIPIV